MEVTSLIFPMILLSLERSSSTPGAALYRDGKQLADWTAGRLDDGSSSIFSMAADCNRLLSTTPEKLSTILLTIGPGSFSGIRSAISFAQGLALPNPDIRILGVSTAAVIAWQHLRLATGGASCVVMGDARREHIWKADFIRTATGLSTTEITLHPYASFSNTAPRQNTNIQYRKLDIADIQPNLLDDFDRRQEVTKCWRKLNNEWVLVNHCFVDDWGAKRKQELACRDIPNAMQNGGFCVAAYDHEKLAGIAVVKGGLIGSQKQYIEIYILQVDREYRRKGIGRELFLMCVGEAQKTGAKKFYVCANSSQESHAFYRAMGCVEAVETVPELFKNEPYDVHMEYALPSLLPVLSPDAERLASLVQFPITPSHPTAEGLASLYFAEPSLFIENPLPIYLHNAV